MSDDFTAFSKSYIVYQGHHGDAGAQRADVILPGAAYTEKNATYVNIDGRVQLTRLAVYPPGDAREDWTIIRALSEFTKHTLPYDNLRQLRARMVQLNSNFLNVDQAVPALWQDFGTEGHIKDTPFESKINNYYMTDPISRASETMAHCTEVFLRGEDRKTPANG